MTGHERYWGLGAIALLGLAGCSQEAALGGSSCGSLVGAIARGQQAYFAEHGRFAEAIAPLGLGLPEATPDCRLQIAASPTQVLIYGLPPTATVTNRVAHCFLGLCWRSQIPATSWVAGVFVDDPDQDRDPATNRTLLTIECYADVGITQLQPPQRQDGLPVCPQGTQQR